MPFIDVGTAGGMHYLAWPLVEGTTLDKLVEKEGPLSPERAALYVVQAAEGLELCHQQKLFHGLLKPSNLMLGTDGQVRILDFGIGCLLAETEGESLVDTMSTANSVNSGLDCASPESIMDPTNLTPLGDQYSLGCVLYFLVAGRYPFPDGTAVEKMMAHQHKQPPSIRAAGAEVAGGIRGDHRETDGEDAERALRFVRRVGGSPTAFCDFGGAATTPLVAPGPDAVAAGIRGNHRGYLRGPRCSI